MSFLKNLMEQGLTSANEVKEIFMTPKEKAANYKAVREACEAKLKEIGPSIDQLKGWGKVIESLKTALNKLNKDGVVDVAEAKKAMAKVLSEALLEHMNPIVVRRFVELVEEDDDKEDEKDEKSDDKDEKSDKGDEKSDDKDDSKDKSEKDDDKEDKDKDDKKEESLDSISADDFFESSKESDDDLIDDLNESIYSVNDNGSLPNDSTAVIMAQAIDKAVRPLIKPYMLVVKAASFYGSASDIYVKFDTLERSTGQEPRCTIRIKGFDVNGEPEGKLKVEKEYNAKTPKMRAFSSPSPDKIVKKVVDYFKKKLMPAMAEFSESDQGHGEEFTESEKQAAKFAKARQSKEFAVNVYNRVLADNPPARKFHSLVPYAMKTFEGGLKARAQRFSKREVSSVLSSIASVTSNYDVTMMQDDSGFLDASGYHSNTSGNIFCVYLRVTKGDDFDDYDMDSDDLTKIHKALKSMRVLKEFGGQIHFSHGPRDARDYDIPELYLEVCLYTDFDYKGMHKWMKDSVLSESLDDEQDPLKEWLKSQEHSMCREEFKDFQESLDEAKASMTPTEYTEHLLDLKEKQQMKLGDVVANAKKFIKQSSLIQSKIGSYKNPYVRELVEKSFLHFIKNGHIDYFAMDGILLSATRPAAKKLTQKVRQRFKTLKVSVTESTVAGASYSFTLKPKGKDSLDMVEVDRVKAMIEREGFKVLSYSNSANSLDVFEEIFDVEFVPGYYENRMRKSLKDAITETAFKAYKFETTESAEFAEAEEAFDAVTEACLEFYEMSDEDRAALSDEDRADYIASLESYFVLSELAECDEEDEDEESTEESVESDEGFGLDEATQVVKVRRNSANRKKTRAARTKGRAKKKASQKKLNRMTKGKSVRQKRKIAARLKAKSKGISVKQAAMQNKMGRAKAKSRRAGGKAVVVRGNNLYAGLIDDLESKSVTEAIREVLPKLESQFTVETESLKESVIAQDVAATLTLGFEKLIAESSALMESLHEKEMDNDARIEAMTSLEGLIRDAESMLSGANATFEEASKTLLGLCEQFEETQEIA